MDMIRFAHPEWAILFLLIPLFILVFFLAGLLRRKAIKRFAREETFRYLSPLFSMNRRRIRFILLMCVLSMLVLAAMNPQTGSRMEEATLEGVDIIVALDVSRSMLAEDMSPNRLERAKLAVNRLVDQLDNDRFGLVVFAGTAHTQIPLTTDIRAAKMLMRPLNTESIPVQGTAIEAAINRSLASFPEGDTANKTIILVSDGESHEDNPVEAARRAKSKGITIHTVGVGSRDGAPVPNFVNGERSGYLRDDDGHTVISRYDEETLRQIADITGGVFRHGGETSMGLSEILDTIRQMEAEAYETFIFTEYESRYHYLVALALCLLLIELLLSDRKNKWLRTIPWLNDGTEPENKQ